jgi:hypothetical protein
MTHLATYERLLRRKRVSSAQTARQLTWLRTRMKEAAPQALLVAT